MVSTLIITAAGMSTRFSRSVGKECLKCIYHENGIRNSILYRLLDMGGGFDRVVLVGGFRFDELKRALEEDLRDLCGNVDLVRNDRYSDYGSGYSLYLGMRKAIGYGPGDITFMEGDLWVERGDLEKVRRSSKDVASYNRETISADRAVAFYLNRDSEIRYVYDTSHNALEIKEPFTAIYNSAQVWKFSDVARAEETLEGMDAGDWKGTNLTFIQGYFDRTDPRDIELVGFSKWVNCNTVSDYRSIDWGIR